MILYLHGFRSGPQSHKARTLGSRMAQRGLGDAFLCPQLPASPAEASRLGENLVKSRPVTALVGSSLGGYYATWLAQKFQLRGVLINPSVLPQVSLARQVGVQQWLYSGEQFCFTPRHLDELRAIEVPVLAEPQRFWLMVEEGDETLDYRQAVRRYAGARQTVLPGGNHSFTRWEDYLDAVIDFCLGISAQAPAARSS